MADAARRSYTSGEFSSRPGGLIAADSQATAIKKETHIPEMQAE